jgi:hypothetical protein
MSRSASSSDAISSARSGSLRASNANRRASNRDSRASRSAAGSFSIACSICSMLTIAESTLQPRPRQLSTLVSIFGECENLEHLFAIYPGKPLQKLINRRAGFEIFEQRLHWDARPFESPRAAQRICRTFNCRARAPIDHLSILSPVVHTAKRLCLFGNPQLKRSVLSTINFCPDGLPKLKDFPAAIGGSGATMPE